MSDRERGSLFPLREANAIILAGGLGTRMEDSVPKPLIQVAPGVRIIDFPSRLLAGAGVEQVALSVSGRTVDNFRRYLTNGEAAADGFNTRLIVKDDPEGVIPAIVQPVSELGMRDKPLIVVHGDELLDVDLAAMFRHHQESGNAITVCVSGNARAKNKIFFEIESADSRPRGATRFASDRRVIEAWEEGFTHTLTGLWIISVEQIQFLLSSPNSDAFIFNALERGLLRTYPANGLFMNMNTREDVEAARRLLSR